MPTLILRPNGAGAATHIASQYPSSGYHWEKVDDVVADEGATFVFTVIAWQGDLYALEDTAQTGTINWIKVWIRVGGYYGYGYVHTLIFTGGSVFDGNLEGPITSGYLDFYTQYFTNPQGGSWTWAQLNALQAGICLIPWSGWQLDCTQVYVEVDYTLPIEWEKSISDTITISDSTKKTVSIPRTDAIIIADFADYAMSGIAFHSAASQRRYRAETFSTWTFPDPAGAGFISTNDGYYMIAGYGDTGFPSIKEIGLFREELLAITDAIKRTMGLDRADSIAIADAFSKVSEFYRSKDDIILILDAFSKVSEFYYSMADTITITDSENKSIQLPRTELLVIADAITKTIGAAKADTLVIVDLEIKTIGKNLVDLIIITDGEVPIGVLFVPPGIYTIEVHDTDGSLVAVLEKAYNISLEEKINAPWVVNFDNPADDSKLSYLTRAREVWIRDVANNTVIAKTKLLRKEDARD